MSKRVDLTGQVFGKLTVLGRGEDYVSPSGSHLLRWKCLCECGNEINATTSQLKRGLSSCGCVSKREDLTNRRFGRLTVLYAADDYISPKGSRMARWHCKCECGNETDVLGMSLKNGDTKSCGICTKPYLTTDYTGKQFGELYVVKKIQNSHPPKYLCKCSCGQEVEVLQKALSSGKKTHCGCKKIRKTTKQSQQKNYIGKTIGQLTVLEELEPHTTPNGSKQRIVKCQCSCGKVFTTRLASAKKNGKCRDCISKEQRVDLTGKRFGKLVVLSMAEDYISPSGFRLSRCKCRCDCGNISIVNMSGLVSGTTKSCGCLHNTSGLLKDNPVLVEKYDFAKNNEIGIDFETVTARSNKKIWWRCSECNNSWQATVASQHYVKTQGCPYCSGRLVIKGKTDLQTLYPHIAKEWNYEKNGDLTPSDVSPNSGIKVWWMCSEGHEWKALVSNRTSRKSGCPRCNIENASSFCEQAVFYYIKKAFPDAINSDKHLNVELDVYIPSINVAVEYDGQYWHKSKRRNLFDEKKTKLCLDAGIRLIRIREPNLPKIDGCISIIRSDTNTNESLDKAIGELLRLLGVNTIVVDTELESGFILDQYATKKHEHSLAVCVPDIASEWHPKKNGNMTPDRITKYSSRKVWWLGKCGHEWQEAPKSRVNRQSGCPVCMEREMNKAVICVETGVVYKNALEAANSVGLKGSQSIRRCCRGERKTAAKYHWAYYT